MRKAAGLLKEAVDKLPDYPTVLYHYGWRNIGTIITPKLDKSLANSELSNPNIQMPARRKKFSLHRKISKMANIQAHLAQQIPVCLWTIHLSQKWKQTNHPDMVDFEGRLTHGFLVPPVTAYLNLVISGNFDKLESHSSAWGLGTPIAADKWMGPPAI